MLLQDVATPVRDKFLPVSVLISITGAIVLVASELLASVGALTWALSGLLHLGPIAETLLAAALGIPSVIAVVLFARAVIAVESAAAGD